MGGSGVQSDWTVSVVVSSPSSLDKGALVLLNETEERREHVVAPKFQPNTKPTKVKKGLYVPPTPPFSFQTHFMRASSSLAGYHTRRLRLPRRC